MGLSIIIMGVNYEHHEYMLVKTNSYREKLSGDAFQRWPWNPKTQKYKPMRLPDGRIITKQTDLPLGKNFEMMRKSYERNPELFADMIALLDKVRVFETLWEFYDHIGWDHKKKRFKNVPEPY